MFVRLNPTVATSSCCISCFMDWNGFKRWLNNHGHFTGKTWGNDMKWWACWWISTAFCCQSPMFFVAQITSSWVRWWAAELPLPILRSDGETGKHQGNTRDWDSAGIFNLMDPHGTLKQQYGLCLCVQIWANLHEFTNCWQFSLEKVC